MASSRYLSLLLVTTLSLPVLGLAATHAAVSSGPARDVAMLEKRIDQWLDGYNKADSAQMMDVFSDDFTMEDASAPGSLDKTQTAHLYDGIFAKYDTRIEGITDEVRASGDMAFDRGHFTITLTPKAGGTTVVQKGRFLEVWERKDGVWKVQRLMNISDAAH
jgi:ketosteroid isomerase-like protein